MLRFLKWLFILVIIFDFGLCFGQDSLLLLNKVKDFGVIPEDQGAISHTFSFINHYQDPIGLSAVSTSCGCTTPSWSKKMILPSDTGSVTIAFNPYNRPGKFEKTVSVFTQLDSVEYKFYINGTVKPSHLSIEEAFPYQYGDLRFQFKTLNIGYLYNNSVVEKGFEFYNVGKEAVEFDTSFEHPDHIAVRIEPEQLQVGESGQLVVTYDPQEFDQLGFNQDYLAFNTKDGQRLDFTVIATVEEYFPPMNDEELALAPRLFFQESQYDFDRILEGEILTRSFKMDNEGKQPLSIRKVITNCSCTVAAVDKNTLSPGQTGSLIVQFDTSGRRGNQIKTVSIFTNDPVNPIQTLVVRAYVVTQ